jgi:hypothetical protein
VPRSDVACGTGGDEFIRFDVPEHAPGMVDAILRAHGHYESARALRQSWMRVLAGLGGVLAFTVLVPGADAPGLRRIAALAWALCGGATLTALVLEGRWYLQRKRLLDATKLTDGARDAS